MPLAGVLAGIYGLMTVTSSLAQYQQGQYASEMARRQAEALQQQSQFAQQNAGRKIAVDDYRASHILSSIQAKAAASGIEGSEGSTAMVYESSAEEARINDMYTKYAANVESSQLDYQATLTKIEGEQEKEAETFGAIGGAISGGIRAYGAGTGQINPFDEFTTSSNF